MRADWFTIATGTSSRSAAEARIASMATCLPTMNGLAARTGDQVAAGGREHRHRVVAVVGVDQDVLAPPEVLAHEHADPRRVPPPPVRRRAARDRVRTSGPRRRRRRSGAGSCRATPRSDRRGRTPWRWRSDDVPPRPDAACRPASARADRGRGRRPPPRTRERPPPGAGGPAADSRGSTVRQDDEVGTVGRGRLDDLADRSGVADEIADQLSWIVRASPAHGP